MVSDVNLHPYIEVPYVISAEDITKTPYVERELMLVKVGGGASLNLARTWRAPGLNLACTWLEPGLHLA